VTTDKIKIADAAYTQVRSLGEYAKSECQSMTRIFSVTPGSRYSGDVTWTYSFSIPGPSEPGGSVADLGFFLNN
jgi:hypothetical protein